MATIGNLGFRFLRVSQVKALNRYVEGMNSSCVRDEGMLESAVNSPINQHHYGQENDLFRLAAALSSKLIKNHAFGNGNKRTALFAANLFLLEHGVVLQRNAFESESNDALTQAHNAVAMGTMEESQLAEIYRAWGQPATDDNRAQVAKLHEV